MQKINWLERKDYNGDNYYDVTLEDGRKARLNEKTKKGEIYPNWDSLTPGTEIDDSQLWQSDKGYWYIFPPKQEGAKKGGFSGIKAAQERKAESIEKFQDSKEHNIMVSSTMRDAVLLAIEEFKLEGGTTPMHVLITKWRDWLIAHWDIDPQDRKPF